MNDCEDTKADVARCVATVGLHGSASTWVFNVARELLLAAYPAGEIIPFYADRIVDIPREFPASARLLIKSHHGSPELENWLAARPTTLILSLRDPRDAALSMSQRFEAPLLNTAGWLRNDCFRLKRLMTQPHLLLRYETRFFEKLETVAAIAAHLSVETAAPVMESIFKTYCSDAVRAFAADLENLPAKRLGMVAKFRFDRVTQILASHIGDGTSGKWRSLPEYMQDQLTDFFRPFLMDFGYEE